MLDYQMTMAVIALHEICCGVVAGHCDAGDKIVVAENLDESEVVINKDDVTIEAALGKPIVWKSRPGIGKLILISSVKNVRIKGFTLDGGDSLDGGAVARIDPHAIDLDCAQSRNQVAVTAFAEDVFDGLADL